MRYRRFYALVEQALLSGSNLLAFLIFARHQSTEHWGQFGFAYSVALFTQGFQRATIVIPLVTYSTADWVSTRSHWHAMNSGLALAAAMALLFAALTAFCIGGWVVKSFAMAALMVPSMFMYEFARRSTIQEDRWPALVAAACAYAAVALAFAVCLPWFSRPEWVPAIGISSAALTATLLYTALGGMPPLKKPRLWSPAKDYRSFVGWSAASHLGFSGYNFGVQAVLGAVAGPAALGVFHACRILVQPVNTLIAATDSVDKPRAARALAEKGGVGLRDVLRRSGFFMATLALPYLLIIGLASEAVLAFAFGDQYVGQGRAVWFWCAVALCMVSTQPIESGLYIARRTRLLFFGRMVASALALGVAYPLSARLGVAGALIAIACGYITAGLIGALTLSRVPGDASKQ